LGWGRPKPHTHIHTYIHTYIHIHAHARPRACTLRQLRARTCVTLVLSKLRFSVTEQYPGSDRTCGLYYAGHRLKLEMKPRLHWISYFAGILRPSRKIQGQNVKMSQTASFLILSNSSYVNRFSKTCKKFNNTQPVDLPEIIIYLVQVSYIIQPTVDINRLLAQERK
jgi:hypothetical protein